MDLQLSPAEQAFRDEIRSFLQAQLPPQLARAQRLTPAVFVEYDVAMAWHRILYGRGWSAPDWPVEYGGPGWNLTERYLWHIENGRAGAPMASQIALALVGPVLMRFGTPTQKARFLPRIVSGDDYWCQGFSEPGAGSDLASLRTRAVAEDDVYVVNGAKIWTTHAHYANWMIALVRTRDTGRRQQGISCLLIDMQLPGIQVRPILTIGGDHEVNEVIFDHVRVPRALLVGEEDQGWDVAKYLLEFERGGLIASGGLRSQLAQIAQLAEGGIAGLPCVADEPAVAARIAEVGIDVDALEMMELRTNWALRSGQNPGAASSFLKLRASRLQQDISGLAIDVLGEAALRWLPQRPLYGVEGTADDEALWPVVPRYLNNRANTIFGGSSEIQKGIIAKSLLGL